MRVIAEPAQHGRVAATRVVLLPAAYAAPEDFLRAGFVTAVRERNLAIDLVFVEPQLPHLTDRTILQQLRRELLLPAREQGCRALWLGGVSLGGFAALACAQRHPRDIDGLCLLAPYLGSHLVTGEISRANGLRHWTAGEVADHDEERRIWRFIQRQSAHPARLHLGFGREDRFADAQRLMAAALAPESLDVVPGGHEWPVWRHLWENFLSIRFSANRTTTDPTCPRA
jgi:pimeloyl-ACP methyl ester carboxylesterase